MSKTANSYLFLILETLSTVKNLKLKVITEETEFFFILSVGGEFNYNVLSDSYFSVKYTNLDEIIDMLSQLFDEGQIIDIQILTD